MTWTSKAQDTVPTASPVGSREPVVKRHRLSWSGLRAERVGLWGLGAEGSASLRKLRELGVEPTAIVDDNPERVAQGSSGLGVPVLPTSGEGLEALLACSVVVKTPGISRYRPEATRLEAAGIPVVGGLGLWLEELGEDGRQRVVCVTGTNGKSTTTSVLAHLASGLGSKAFAGGNLGGPPYDPSAPSDMDLWVIEVSSYQATDVASSPPLVAVTALSPDHLPWHAGDPELYFRDKLSLCHQPGARLTVASAASPLLVDRRRLLGPAVRWLACDRAWDHGWAEPLGLAGPHNVLNVSIARACLEALEVPGSDDYWALRTAAEGFAGLDSRLQFVATAGGVDFFDDSLSTNVLPTVAAVDALPGRGVALIAGGMDRAIDYQPLAEHLARRDEPTLVLTVYTTGPKVQQAVENIGADHVTALPCRDLAQAVQRGWEWARAQPDGVVLLSPAAASFDQFRDYRHRARVFRDAIANLTPGV